MHPKADPQAQEAFRNHFASLVEAFLPDGLPVADVLVYFQDEARIGQKGMLSRIWAWTGTRPRMMRDHRHGSVYLFSAGCPATGAAAGHVCARANTDAKSCKLDHDSDRT